MSCGKLMRRFDMDLVNDPHKDSALVLPHRNHNLLTGDCLIDNHSQYLGNALEAWNAIRDLADAHYAHFSNWPFPKPWIEVYAHLKEEAMPQRELRLIERSTG